MQNISENDVRKHKDTMLSQEIASHSSRAKKRKKLGISGKQETPVKKEVKEIRKQRDFKPILDRFFKKEGISLNDLPRKKKKDIKTLLNQPADGLDKVIKTNPIRKDSPAYKTVLIKTIEVVEVMETRILVPEKIITVPVLSEPREVMVRPGTKRQKLKVKQQIIGFETKTIPAIVETKPVKKRIVKIEFVKVSKQQTEESRKILGREIFLEREIKRIKENQTLNKKINKAQAKYENENRLVCIANKEIVKRLPLKDAKVFVEEAGWRFITKSEYKILYRKPVSKLPIVEHNRPFKFVYPAPIELPADMLETDREIAIIEAQRKTKALRLKLQEQDRLDRKEDREANKKFVNISSRRNRRLFGQKQGKPTFSQELRINLDAKDLANHTITTREILENGKYKHVTNPWPVESWDKPRYDLEGYVAKHVEKRKKVVEQPKRKKSQGVTTGINKTTKDLKKERRRKKAEIKRKLIDTVRELVIAEKQEKLEKK